MFRDTILHNPAETGGRGEEKKKEKKGINRTLKALLVKREREPGPEFTIVTMSMTI
jgi:hypothetical protein